MTPPPNKKKMKNKRMYCINLNFYSSMFISVFELKKLNVKKMLASLNGEKKARSENILNLKMQKGGGGFNTPRLIRFS